MRLAYSRTVRLPLPALSEIVRHFLPVGLMFGLFLILINPLFANPNARQELLINPDYSLHLVPTDIQPPQIQLNFGAHPYRYLLWTQPYLLAILLLMIGINRWIRQTSLDLIETCLLLGSSSLLAAVLLPFLVESSWWLILLALIILGLSVEKPFYYWPNLKWPGLLHRSNAGKTQAGADKIWLIRLLLSGLALSLFITFAPSFSYDTKLFLSWTDKIHHYGPFDIYQHANDLDYPPLIVYLLWIYGWIMAPFGLITNLLTFKIAISLTILGGTFTIWLLARQKQHHYPLDSRTNLKTGLVLLTLSPALVFNPAVWGQVDALLNLMLVAAFWWLYRTRGLLAGLWLGLLLIFKPQAWFVLPLLAIILIKEAGWKKGMLAGTGGLIAAGVLTVAAFGGHLSHFMKFWSQPALAGDSNQGSYEAFNLLWLLDFHNKAASPVIFIIGLGLIGLVYLLVLFPIIRGTTALPEEVFGAALIMITFFLFSIKMHERYLYYSLPLLALACLYNRRLYKPLLLLNLCCLLNTLHSYLKIDRPQYDKFYFWPELFGSTTISGLTILIWAYLLWLYTWSVVRPAMFNRKVKVNNFKEVPSLSPS